MTIAWNKQAGDVWTCAAGPFVIVVRPKGDGRWTWEVTNGAAKSPAATGVGRSLGAARSVAEQYVKRSGLV